jgi:hypothetical protein
MRAGLRLAFPATDAPGRIVDGPIVTVLYSCTPCATRDREVVVRQRGPDEDVVAWVNHVRDCVGADHATFSPLCVSPTCDLKIPLPKDARIGDAYKQ